MELDGIGATFDTRKSRIIALLNLIRLSYADGALEIEEECLLKEISRGFGIDDEEFKLLDNWVAPIVELGVRSSRSDVLTGAKGAAFALCPACRTSLHPRRHRLRMHEARPLPNPEFALSR